MIVHLWGGLGNQLFQYAMGRAASLRLGVPLLLDSSDYGTPNCRRPMLIDRYNIVAEISSRGDFPTWNRGYWLDTIGAFLYSLRRPLIVERPLVHDSRVLNAKPGTYFMGFWQQEAYFSEISKSLREELTLRSPPSAANQDMLQKIQSSHAVSVHVRRGDYVGDKTYASCSLGYYARAAELIAKRSNKQLTFFIFSDEPLWAAANLVLPGKTQLVNFNSDATCYEDMRLMSSCHHNIIANSTFSWWGAWLNQNPDKIVVAPKTWFHTAKLSNERINAAGYTAIDNLSA